MNGEVFIVCTVCAFCVEYRTTRNKPQVHNSVPIITDRHVDDGKREDVQRDLTEEQVDGLHAMGENAHNRNNHPGVALERERMIRSEYAGSDQRDIVKK